MKTELPKPSLVNGSTRYSSLSAAPPMMGTNGMTGRPSIASLEARVRHFNSDINAGCATFRAAVLLLAAVEYGRNIDALSRRTGYPRGFVAQCARRWTDNGVWTPQGLVTEWSPADEASGAFWNDVAVAEGKLCRRVNPEGEIEWAPPGFWNKSYEFIDAAAKSQLVTVYRDPAAAGKNVPPDADADADDDADDDDDDGERVPVVPPSSKGPATDPAPAAPAGPAPATPDRPPQPRVVTPDPVHVHRPTPPPTPRPVRPQVQQPPAELFPDTVWIG